MVGISYYREVRYWWVNQGGTYRHEVPGGYLWSPQRNNNGSRSPFYEFMREITPGDLVLSYCDSEIRAIGVALNSGYEAPKPIEFGAVGSAWADLGWKVDVEFTELESSSRVRVSDHLTELMPLLPERYSPINRTGTVQSNSRCALPPLMASAILGKMHSTIEWTLALAIDDFGRDVERRGEDKLEAFLMRAPLGETERLAQIAARRGQGRFRDGVALVEPECRFPSVRNSKLLIASHIQPWAQCNTNEQRVDCYNGLLLTPTYDRLFDRGFVSFSEDSRLLISPHLPGVDVDKLRIDPEMRTRPFREGQLSYLAYHRDHVFRAS